MSGPGVVGSPGLSGGPGVATRPEVVDPGLVVGLEPGLLAAYNLAGVLAPADVHTALRVGRLAGENRPAVLLAAALAVRAPRVGHVSVDLAAVASSAMASGDDDDEIDLSQLPWPDPAAWLERVRQSPLVASGTDYDRPLHLEGSNLYLDRYWRDEVLVAAELGRRASGRSSVAATAAEAVAPPVGSSGRSTGSSDQAWVGRSGRSSAEVLSGRPDGALLERLYPGAAAADQRAAAASAVQGLLTVIAGGPGTGKTTTVARLLALLVEEAERTGRRPPLVALAAPTGKAALRMEEAVRSEADHMPTTDSARAHLAAVTGLTLHRLLGYRPDRTSRFRHHRGHRLPHDLVVIDEASMVSLALMARLVEALRPDARLVLVGDPDQLVSVEAGAVLADIVGRAMDPLRIPAPQPGPAGAAARPAAGEAGSAGAAAATAALAASGPAGPGLRAPAIARCVALLRTNHRFAGVLAGLAAAVQGGDDDTTISLLRSGAEQVEWVELDPSTSADAVARVRAITDSWSGQVLAAARSGRPDEALELFERERVLCAHRRGGAGVALWNARIQAWLADAHPELAGEAAWYAGRPVVVTSNDYALGVFNGDTGVVVAAPAEPLAAGWPVREWPVRERLGREAAPGRETAPRGAARPGHDAVGSGAAPPDGPGVRVAFRAAGGIRLVSPYRLAHVDTVFAMTVHKSQGSEFDRVTVLLPPAASRLLTRELLYTAITRARRGVRVIGTEAAVRAAVGRRVARASGLGPRLWGDDA